MSQENLALVRRALDAFNRRELGGYLERIANDFVLHSQFGGVEGRTYRGHGDIPRYFEDLADAWHDYRAEPLDLIQGEEGKVACTLRVTPEAEQSGIKMGKRLGAVFTVRRGRSSGSMPIRLGRRPSKPPGCRSRPFLRSTASPRSKAGRPKNALITTR
jgi:ketosteroid isomerase-like protein